MSRSCLTPIAALSGMLDNNGRRSFVVGRSWGISIERRLVWSEAQRRDVEQARLFCARCGQRGPWRWSASYALLDADKHTLRCPAGRPHRTYPAA